MALYIFIPYAPSDAEVREYASDAIAIKEFRKYGFATTRAGAYLVADRGRITGSIGHRTECLASFADGEFSLTEDLVAG